MLHRDDQVLSIKTVAGAAPGSVWVFLPERDVLFAGDTVVVGTHPPMEATPDTKAWLDTLKGLRRPTDIPAQTEQLGPDQISADRLSVQSLEVLQGMIGGLRKESMIHGKEAIDAEMAKARTFIGLGRFIPGPDHFVLSNVSWEHYRYFMEQLREVVMTTRPGI